MFACLYSLSAPHAALINVAQDFTPRYEVIGPLVMLDLSGLSRLFGSAREIGEQLRTAMAGAPVRIAIAPSQTASALLALGRPGLMVVALEEQRAALASLQVHLLGELERLHSHVRDTETQRHGDQNLKTPCLRAVSRTLLSHTLNAPHIAEMEDVLPYFQSCLDRTSEAARAPHVNCGGGWTHPRDSHAATLTKRARRSVPATKDTEHPHTAAGAAKTAKVRAALKDVDALLDVLRRWGVKTLGTLAALPAGEVYERLGARGVLWQRMARGDDQGPLVPCVPDDPFEGTLDLEWPIEGLEPLSFVLARLFEPLADRLERADRGAAILHTHLRLTTREVYARTVQLPAPMRDPKTLRTLVLLDLESNPPSAAIDRVRVLVEPTPARVLQWTLYERAQPSPEQVSTLLARLTALMGEGHVGSPRLVNSWKPGAFEIGSFAVTQGTRDQGSGASQGSGTRDQGSGASQGSGTRDQGSGASQGSGTRDQGSGASQGSGSRDQVGNRDQDACATALRRFRLPIPARVQMQDGRPVRVMVDRRGVAGGAVQQSAGPWRTSGEWWNDGQVGQVGRVGQVGKNPLIPHRPYQTHQTYQPSQAWDRDEWDVLLTGGEAYRIYVERDVGQWFVEAVID